MKQDKDVVVGADEEVPLDIDDPELNAAATKIQAVQKGRKARADVAQMKAEQDAGHGTALDNSQALENNGEKKLELHNGLTPQEVAEKFFRAVELKDYDIWLHTLHMEARSHPSNRAPGPFAVQEWETLRERVRKHSVQYRLEDEKGDADRSYFVTLRFAPLYGDVPGYDEGERLSKRDILLELEKDSEEWRIMAVHESS
mmetsp:Transcript_18757/g.52211  ORF Transcript_18757/g.52211 Transcript_18757/m.52211 type:complete len:200 (-) Transcript_18757:154-753(-)